VLPLRNQFITPKSALQAGGSYCHATAIFAVNRSGKADKYHDTKPSFDAHRKGVKYDFGCDRNLDNRWRDCRASGPVAHRRRGGRLYRHSGNWHSGASVGGWLFDVLNISIGTGLVNNIITAFVGAAVLLVVVRVWRSL
jgi:hypothetical protein